MWLKNWKVVDLSQIWCHRLTHVNGIWLLTCHIPNIRVSMMASLIIFAHCLVTIDDVVHNVIEISSRTELAKIAVKSAFCLIPVNPLDHLFSHGMEYKYLHWYLSSFCFILCTFKYACMCIHKGSYDIYK